MLHTIWLLLHGLLVLLGDGKDPSGLLPQEPDRGHEMDPNG